MRFRSVSPLRLALPLALAATLLAAIPTSAFSPSLRTAAVSGGIVQASVAGTHKTFVWRFLVERPGATQRLRVFLERGDVAWGGSVSVQERVDGRWVTVERDRLDGRGRLQETVCAEEIGACVLAGTVKPAVPGGAQRLQATFRLKGHGTWTIAGSVRQSVSDPWIYGPWIAATPDEVRF
jgi:hypothetical protein